LGWYQNVDGEAVSLQILNPGSVEPIGATSVTIGPIKIGGPPPGITVDEFALQTEANVSLGAKIKLLGFDITSGTGSEPTTNEVLLTSSSLELTFYWQALAKMDTDYTVFAHVRNAAGETAAQKDGPPAGGAYPTRLWDPGEIIKDQFSIPLEQLEPGRYELVVGMYDFSTGVRLPIKDSRDGTFLVSSFEVND
jgi:hypothetical protein